MDKYDAAHDHYCYPGTTVLKNKLNIQDEKGLEEAERRVTEVTIGSVRYADPPYDLDYMAALHQQLFDRLYDWAGTVRNVDIAKGGTRFCNCRRIEAEAAKIFAGLENEDWLAGLYEDEFCGRLAEHYCELNMIHPFREGNGRVQRLLFEQLALSAGFQLDWESVTAEEWLAANIDGVRVNYEPMEQIFARIVSSLP